MRLGAVTPGGRNPPGEDEMRAVTWRMVALLCACLAHAARAERITLLTTDRGRFYLHGALIPPPYEVSLSFHLEDATRSSTRST